MRKIRNGMSIGSAQRSWAIFRYLLAAIFTAVALCAAVTDLSTIVLDQFSDGGFANKTSDVSPLGPTVVSAQAPTTLRITPDFSAPLANETGSEFIVKVVIGNTLIGTPTASMQITLPYYMTYVSGVGNGNSVVSGGGQNASVVNNCSSPCFNPNGTWAVDITVRVPPLSDLPTEAPTGTMTAVGSFSNGVNTYPINIVQPHVLAYNPVTWTRSGDEPVGLGGEMSFNVKTQRFPNAPTGNSSLTLWAPANTEFVADSIVGHGNGVITNGTALGRPTKTITWTTQEYRSIDYRLRVLPTTPISVSQIIHDPAAGLMTPYYTWRFVRPTGVTQGLVDRATTIPIEVDHTGVNLSITVPNTRFKPTDTFPATIKASLTGTLSRTITFNDPVAKEVSFSGLPEDEILSVESPATPPPFELTTANPTRTFTALVLVNELGITQLQSSLSYSGPGGVTGTKTATKKVSAPPFSVDVEIKPRITDFNRTPASKKSARCQQIETTTPTIRNCIEITVKVRNDSEQTITNVTLPNAANPLRLINEVDPSEIGEPVRELEHTFPVSPITLVPGAEATWSWRMNAFDGSAHLEFEPTVFGVTSGQEIGGHDTETFNIIKDPLLKWGMRPTGGNTAYTSGQNVRADGYIENVSAENGGTPRALRVMVYQMPKDNLGGGFVVPASYGGETKLEQQIFDLPAEGPSRRLDIKNAFRTLRTSSPSRGTAGFGVRLWVVGEDNVITEATDQAMLDDEDGYTDKFNVTLAAEPSIINRSTAACLRKYAPIVCSFGEGFSGEFADSISGLYQFGLASSSELGEGVPRTIAYNLKALEQLWKAGVEGDGDAYNYLQAEAYAHYEILHDLGVMGVGVVKQTPEQFAVAFGSAMGGYMHAIATGDLDEVQRQTGHFLGANPDLLLEPLIVAGTAMRMSKAMKATRAGLADNIVTAAAREQRAAEAATIRQRIAAAKADPNVTDLSTALKSGDILDEETLLDVFGVDQRTLDHIDEIAKNNGVILTFRSRSSIAQELLNNNLAWPKPQALKHKTVSKVDRDFFGYRSQAEGKIEIVEPPASLKDLEGDELESALYEYMLQLDMARPELRVNKALRKEVRDRMKTRVKEWKKYCPELELEDLDAEVSVGVNFDAPQQWARDGSGDLGPKEFRKIHRETAGTVADIATGEQKRVWTIKIDGPNGQPPREVTGDIDFLAILDENGHPLLDDDKRMAVYEQLYQAGLMEHGESMTFRLDDARNGFLQCCVEGAEAMMTVGPWQGPPRAGRFVNNLSVMKTFNAKFRRFRRQEISTTPAGHVELDADGNPRTVTIRNEDIAGEYALINGTPLLDNFDVGFEVRFQSLLFDDIYRSYLNAISLYFPHVLLDILTGDDELKRGAGVGPEFRRGGPVLQAVSVSQLALQKPTELRIWTLANGWQPITREQAIAEGLPGVPDMAPYSMLRNGSLAGSTELVISTLEQMEATGDFFVPGDSIVINPGGATQERRVVQSVNPLRLVAPLAFDHKAGEMVVWTLGPTASNVAISGRVLTAEGFGVRNAVVTLSMPDGQVRTTRSSSFGYYNFDSLEAGQTVVLGVSSKRYTFASRVITLTDNIGDLDIIAEP